ncbi:putative ABC exporter domain-containing protein [Caproiciproducens faecalis]|uniref:ABC exporter domain-containing protein n=1 Tax=Caproiciproducens faecalis TaxID=2820301 RepID=A0ABS7DNL4_9FIRM|nr:putative ABC exporter domain-containing protein [Caproiciproducens faecalis]MBW7572890.1 putative ABC exporter domain-containing protein [Caproiciproducens faecalis]
MRAILYLTRKEIKNGVIDLLHHPAKLVLYLFLAVILGISLIDGSQKEVRAPGSYLDVGILHGVYFAILLFITVPSVLSGLKSGATFFRMSDVNFLFVSPISPKKILAYGLVKQMASTLLMMVFLLFYAGMAINLFGVTVWQVLALVGGIALTVFTVQMITLLVYSYSNGRPERAEWIRTVLYAETGMIVAFVMSNFWFHGANQQALYAALASPYLEFAPVVGWIKGLAFAVINADAARTALFAAINALTVAGSILLFANSNADYYEDVLQSTETTFELKQSVKNGKTSGVRVKETKLRKVTDTGIWHGWGASVFFFKHIREMKRRNRIPFLRTSSFVLVGINVLLALVLQKLGSSGGDGMPASMMMVIALSTSCYLQFFFNVAGDWTLELMKPYIYLVPEKPFAKLFWATLTTLLTPVVDGVLVFAVLGVMLRTGPAIAVICMFIYISMGCIYTAGNVLSQRMFGQLVNKGLLMFAYMIILLILLLPAAGLSLAVYLLVKDLPPVFLGIPVIISNILVSVGVFAACRNVLSSAEMNS